MARKYSQNSMMNLDAKGTAFPSEVKKVMIGSMPTNADMVIAPEDNISGADSMTRRNLSGLSKNKRDGILGKTK